MKHIQSFNEFINESVDYKEGIKQYQVEAVQNNLKEQLQQIFRLSESDIIFIGSAGKLKDKSAISYNINAVVNKKTLIKKNNLQESELKEFIQKQFSRINTSINHIEESNNIHFDWPVKKNDKIEIRLKLSENIDWLKFSRFSPLQGKESEYTGKYREAILSVLTEVAQKKITQYYNDKHVVKEFEEYHFEPEEGLFLLRKTFEGKNGILRKAITLKENRKLITTDPKQFIKILFKNEIDPNSFNTFESILELVNSNDFIYKKKRNLIFEKLRHKLVSMRLDIPEKIK